MEPVASVLKATFCNYLEALQFVKTVEMVAKLVKVLRIVLSAKMDSF